MHFLDAIASLPTHTMLCLIMALAVAFAFEFINGFHDTANAVTTVIYTRTLKATPAVLYSGLLNFIGVLLGGTAIAFGIVNLLPVDLLLEHSSNAALVMVWAACQQFPHPDRIDPGRGGGQQLAGREWFGRRELAQGGRSGGGAPFLSPTRFYPGSCGIGPVPPSRSRPRTVPASSRRQTSPSLDPRYPDFNLRGCQLCAR